MANESSLLRLSLPLDTRTKMEADNYLPVRDDCTYPGCTTCVSFVLMTPTGFQRQAQDAQQLCACGHAWIYHSARRNEVTGVNESMVKGGCVRTGCGGFYTTDSPWSPQTLCACGAIWLTHQAFDTPGGRSSLAAAPLANSSMPIAGSHASSTIALNAPFPPIPALPMAPYTSASSQTPISSVPPVSAFMGVPLPVSGSTNDRRVASYERFSPRSGQNPFISAPQTSTTRNVHNARSSSSRQTQMVVSSSSVAAAPAPDPSGTQTDVTTGSGPLGAGAGVTVDNQHDIEFLVGIYPFQYPSALYPVMDDSPHGPELKMTGDHTASMQFGLQRANLTLVVRFSAGDRTRPIWKSFNDQVKAHCDANHIHMVMRGPGPLRPETPATIPWQPYRVIPVRSRSGPRMVKYEPHGNLTSANFTLETLLAAPFGDSITNHLADTITSESGRTSAMSFLLIGPRYGNLESDLVRIADADGATFPVVSNIESVHRCFPLRVLAGYLPNIHAACLSVCTRANATSAPVSVSTLSVSSLPFVANAPPAITLFPTLPIAPVTLSGAIVPPSAQVVIADTSTAPAQNHGDDDNINSADTNTALSSLVHPSGYGTRHNPLVVRSRSNSVDDCAAPEGRPRQRRRIESSEILRPIDRTDEYEQASSFDVGQWEDALASACRGSDDPMTPSAILRGPTVNAVAHALIFLITWSFNTARNGTFNTALQAAVPSGTECNECPLEALFSPATRRYQIGEGIGSGPMHAVLRAAIELTTSNAALWVDQGAFKTLNFHSSKDGGLPGREAAFRVCGFLCYLHLAVLGVGPEPVSPFLLHAAISGRAALQVDKGFINALDPVSFARLRPWDDWVRSCEPLPAQIDNVTGSELAMLLVHADINTSCLQSRHLSVAECDGIERSLAGRILIGVDDPTLHPDFEAFQAGFNYMDAIHPQLSLSHPDREFQGGVRGFLGAVYNRRVQNVDEFIEHLRFDTPFAGDRDIREYGLENLFRASLERYLHGLGHPVHPVLDGIIPEAARDSCNYAGYRATLLLTAMSGSPLMPVGSTWSLDFSFIHSSGESEVLGSNETAHQNVPTPIRFRACFKEALVTVDAPLQNLLHESTSNAEATVSDTLFDAWLHSALLMSDDFNRI
ncbi:hypothetical protein C8Q78DRAFT_1046861 [Trametes maxima]|nr:hypothetical protein C8Q78DRAFT_1046861 [Trametes maxima]